MANGVEMASVIVYPLLSLVETVAVRIGGLIPVFPVSPGLIVSANELPDSDIVSVDGTVTVPVTGLSTGGGVFANAGLAISAPIAITPDTIPAMGRNLRMLIPFVRSVCNANAGNNLPSSGSIVSPLAR